jgi:NADH dehydrogenase/NADH:ubiquinone oxidoreductase subunit G
MENQTMPLVKTTIDGREIEVRRDRWALDVARELGIDIPTLCHHPALEPYGACRLCVVEVTRGRSTWLTTSCDLPVREGLTIRTDTPAVLRARRMALELLWSAAPQAEALAELAGRLGVQRPRFAAGQDRGRCILCGLCVRVCRKVLGEAAVCFARRGGARRIASPMEEPPADCIGCGACVRACPTGHLRSVEEGRARRIEPFHASLALASCPRCGRTLAPVSQVGHVRDLLPDEACVPDLCPACRRAQAAGKLAEAFAGLAGPRKAESSK